MIKGQEVPSAEKYINYKGIENDFVVVGVILTYNNDLKYSPGVEGQGTGRI